MNAREFNNMVFRADDYLVEHLLAGKSSTPLCVVGGVSFVTWLASAIGLSLTLVLGLVDLPVVPLILASIFSSLGIAITNFPACLHQRERILLSANRCPKGREGDLLKMAQEQGGDDLLVQTLEVLPNGALWEDRKDVLTGLLASPRRRVRLAAIRQIGGRE